MEKYWFIECPYCNHEHEDWQNYIETDDMSGEFPAKCECCGRIFNVKFDTVITFKSEQIEGE